MITTVTVVPNLIAEHKCATLTLARRKGGFLPELCSVYAL